MAHDPGWEKAGARGTISVRLFLSHAHARLKMKTYFDHEKLNVYQVALEFNYWVSGLLASVKAKAAAKDNSIVPRQAFR